MTASSSVQLSTFDLNLPRTLDALLQERSVTRASRNAPDMVCNISPIQGGCFDDLSSGTLDFCIIVKNWLLNPEKLPDGVRSLPLFQDDFVCVVDAANPVGDVLTVEDYTSMPHNVIRVGGLQSMIETAWTVNRLEPSVPNLKFAIVANPSFEPLESLFSACRPIRSAPEKTDELLIRHTRITAASSSFISLLTMVVGTPIVATVQRRLAAKFAGSLPIRILECPIPLDDIVQNLHWHARNDQDPAHILVRECFAAAAVNLR